MLLLLLLLERIMMGTMSVNSELIICTVVEFELRLDLPPSELPFVLIFDFVVILDVLGVLPV